MEKYPLLEHLEPVIPVSHPLFGCQGHLNLVWRTNWVETAVVIGYGAPNVVPSENGPNITECCARQRNFCVQSVVRKRGGRP